MSDKNPPTIKALEVAPRAKKSVYPEPFASMMQGRTKRQLGEFFGLKNFGVNLTHLAPGGQSALLHKHTKQDEFIFVLEGKPTLVTDRGEYALEPGMCAGFPAGGDAHQIVNKTDQEVVYLEVGDRTPGDDVTYPKDDLKAILGPEGNWIFTHKDGSSY